MEEQVILHYSAPEMYNHDRPEMSSATICLGLIVPDKKHEDTYALSVLAQILGGDDNSRLFKRISQRMGLAYGISAVYSGENNVGVFNIGASVPSVSVDNALDAIFEEINKLQTKLVDATEFERLKKQLRFEVATIHEAKWGYVGTIERIFDTGISPQAYMQGIEAVTPGKIREVANKYLPSDRSTGEYCLMIRDPLKKSS